MNRIVIGLIVGIIAGIIDVTPMIMMKLSWDADISAFSMWVIACILIATNDIAIPGFIKGIIIAFMTLTPSAVLIGWKEPMSLLPISVMTLILGSISGAVITKVLNRNK